MSCVALLILATGGGLSRSQKIALDKLEFLWRNNVSMNLQVNFTGGNLLFKMPGVRCCVTHQRMTHLLAALNRVPQPLRNVGQRMEFGVRNGQSINFLANSSEEERVAKWHGFDSFHGLPASASTGWKAGAYSTNGHLPWVLPNVQLHPGWFNETLATLLDKSTRVQPAAFVHMDADIYESTRLVLDELFRRCSHRVGTVFAFDEMVRRRVLGR